MRERGICCRTRDTDTGLDGMGISLWTDAFGRCFPRVVAMIDPRVNCERW